jgi:hypothetical protein
VDTTRFRPYVSLPSAHERLQALEDFLHWLYMVYTSPDHFLRDLHVVLSGLRVGETVHPGGLALLEFLKTLEPAQMRRLQQEVHDTFDGSIPMFGGQHRSFDQPQQVTYPMTGIPRVIIGRMGMGPGQDHFRFIYNFGKAMTFEVLRDMILVQAFEYLDGLNMSALVRCAACTHFTLRRHPRGKTYCSAQCRARSAMAARRQRPLPAAEEVAQPRVQHRKRARAQPG